MDSINQFHYRHIDSFPDHRNCPTNLGKIAHSDPFKTMAGSYGEIFKNVRYKRRIEIARVHLEYAMIKKKPPTSKMMP